MQVKKKFETLKEAEIAAAAQGLPVHTMDFTAYTTGNTRAYYFVGTEEDYQSLRRTRMKIVPVQPMVVTAEQEGMMLAHLVQERSVTAESLGKHLHSLVTPQGKVETYTRKASVFLHRLVKEGKALAYYREDVKHVQLITQHA